MKIEVGQWYRCRDPNSIAHVIGRIFDDTYPCAVVLYVQGELDIVAAYTIDGRYSVDMQDEADLVEHLPDCTGPNWKPQKWRPVSVEDLRDGMKRARFRNFSTAVWRESHLRGARWKGTTLEWHDLVEDRFWIYCEVLDD